MLKKDNAYEPIIPVVTLTDEKGNDIEFDHLMTFKYLEDTYIAVMPIDEVENIGEDEVLLLQISKDEPGNYLIIENEVMLEEIFEVFLDIYSQSLEEDDLEDEELDEELEELGEKLDEVEPDDA